MNYKYAMTSNTRLCLCAYVNVESVVSHLVNLSCQFI